MPKNDKSYREAGIGDDHALLREKHKIDFIGNPVCKCGSCALRLEDAFESTRRDVLRDTEAEVVAARVAGYNEGWAVGNKVGMKLSSEEAYSGGFEAGKNAALSVEETAAVLQSEPYRALLDAEVDRQRERLGEAGHIPTRDEYNAGYDAGAKDMARQGYGSSTGTATEVRSTMYTSTPEEHPDQTYTVVTEVGDHQVTVPHPGFFGLTGKYGVLFVDGEGVLLHWFRDAISVHRSEQ